MKKESLKDVAYRIIKEKIITCKYMPNEFINEEELGKEIGVSRTPIREALSKLEQERLVNILPKRGILVTDISIIEINEIFQARELIEPYIILTDARNIDKSELIRINNILINKEDTTNELEVYSIDEDIHRLLINSSNNRYFVSIMENIYSQNHRLRVLTGRQIEKRLEQTNKEHIEILNYLIKEDWEMASEAMKKHLSNSKRVAIDRWYEINNINM